MLIKNEYGTFIIMEDKIFHIESGRIFNTGPISEEDKKGIVFGAGVVCFTKNRQLHRESNLPAVFASDGSRYWYQKGRSIHWE
jgi:hypothetical protein